MTTKAPDILTAALSHMQDRAATYDKPEGERSMPATVVAFNALTGHNLTAEQGWLFMTVLKLCRTQQGGHRSDNYEDGAAYFALMGEQAAVDRKPSRVPPGWTEYVHGAEGPRVGTIVDVLYDDNQVEQDKIVGRFSWESVKGYQVKLAVPAPLPKLWTVHDGSGCPEELQGKRVYLMRASGHESGPFEVKREWLRKGNDWCYVNAGEFSITGYRLA